MKMFFALALSLASATASAAANLPFAADTQKLDCDKLLPASIVNKVAPGTKPVRQKPVSPSSLGCELEKDGVPQGVFSFECNSSMNYEVDSAKRRYSKEAIPGVGRFAFWVTNSMPMAYDDDTACKIGTMFFGKPKEFAIDALKAVLKETTPAKLK